MKKLMLLLSLMAVGCGSPKTNQTMNVEPSTRVKVTRIAVIEDDLAYNSKRGVYVIEDLATGKQYVGVSGVGISELGSHGKQTGKVHTTETDER